MKQLYCVTIVTFLLIAQAKANQCNTNYEVEVKTTTTFEFKSKSETFHQLTGVLSIKPLNNQVEDYPKAEIFGVQLTQLKEKLNGQTIDSDQWLTEPFAIVIGEAGKVRDTLFLSHIPQNTKDRLKGFSIYLQFPSVDDFTTSQLLREESDSIGHYQTLYRLKSAKQQITQHKYQYVGIDKLNQTSSNPIEQVNIKSYERNITLDECWFRNINSSESMSLSGSAGNFNLTTEQTYRFEKSDSVGSPLFDMPDNFHQWTKALPQTVELTEEEHARLAQEFITELQGLDLLAYRGSELALWLAEYDAVIDAIHQELVKGSFNDKQKMRLFNALGQLDSQNGNMLLLTFINDSELNENDRFRAMRAIANGTSSLTEPLAQRLFQLLHGDSFQGSSELYGAALMSLGAIIKKRTKNNFSEQLLAEIETRLINAETESEQAALVASLGNTHLPETEQTLHSFINSKSPWVRANVASSLGQIGTDSAGKKLQKMLQTESQDKVHSAIFNAMAQYQLETAPLYHLTQIAAESSSEKTRGNAIKVLANQTQNSNFAANQLQRLMKIETSRRNFRKAAQALISLNKNNDTEN